MQRKGVWADFHEFVITPQDTALVTAYRKHQGVRLSGVGGPASGVLLSGVAQEIDIATGHLLLEWDSINHVRLTETYQQRQRHGDGGDGSPRRPFNYFHNNSLAIDQDGDLLRADDLRQRRPARRGAAIPGPHPRCGHHGHARHA